MIEVKVAYFSPIYWDFLKQRPQHIAEELSKHLTVYYIEPSISIVSSLLRRQKSYQAVEFSINKQLKVIRLSGKYRLPKVIELIDIVGINRVYEKLQLQRIVTDCDFIWLGSPVFYDLIKDSGKTIIYDKMDDYQQLTKNKLLKKVIRKNERMLLDNAALCITSSEYLYDEVAASYSVPLVLIRNGVDKKIHQVENEECYVANEINQIKRRKTRIFGYVGSIDHWFDFEVIKVILDHDYCNIIVIVGNNNMPKMKHDRVFYYEAVPKSEVPLIIQTFDVCLYNFKKDSFLDSINPVKVYEYLALNKKIISVSSKETNRFSEYVQLYKNDDELKAILNEIDTQKLPLDNTNDVQKFITENSWESRASKIIEVLSNINILSFREEVNEK
ncbi:hypothetical protein [Paenibacillus sp. YIM B09110]|uniref:hypothetical protein n=1 Tax=Paenibacillus sp. YIM B09110 TaxID=3126102 RepID=UPI00301CE750